MNKISKLSVMAAAAMMSLLAGCQTIDSPEQVRRDSFAPEDQPRELRSLIIAQEATAARQDATLHADDFDNDGLNSLGQQKLDLMLTADEPADPMVVYLDFADAEVQANAQHSVVDYLKMHGLPEAQVSVKNGPNPGASTPAADAVAALHAVGSSAPATAGGAAAPAGAGASGGATASH